MSLFREDRKLSPSFARWRRASPQRAYAGNTVNGLDLIGSHSPRPPSQPRRIPQSSALALRLGFVGSRSLRLSHMPGRQQPASLDPRALVRPRWILQSSSSTSALNLGLMHSFLTRLHKTPKF